MTITHDALVPDQFAAVDLDDDGDQDLIVDDARILIDRFTQLHAPGQPYGTNTVFAWGDTADSLRDRENIADAASARVGQGWSAFEAWEDAHVVHAPAGSFAGNGFGLFDMHGNITEMCADLEVSYAQPCRPGDGLRALAAPAGGNAVHIGRGGCWQSHSDFARCADRQEVLMRVASNLNGFRPTRLVTGSPR